MLPALLSALLLFPQAGPAPDASDLYQLVFLRPNPARKPVSKEEAARIQSEHMANIIRMSASGLLIGAGPFEDKPTTISGIFIFRASSSQAVKDAAAKDATVVANRNIMDLHEWRGPKGVGVEYARLREQDRSAPDNMGVHPFVMLHRGSTWDQLAAERGRILAAQAEYIVTLRSQQKLAAAGPIEGSDGFLGIVIFKRIPEEEAKHLIEESPAIKAGLYRAEYHRWWCAEHVLPW